MVNERRHAEELAIGDVTAVVDQGREVREVVGADGGDLEGRESGRPSRTRVGVGLTRVDGDAVLVVQGAMLVDERRDVASKVESLDVLDGLGVILLLRCSYKVVDDLNEGIDKAGGLLLRA